MPAIHVSHPGPLLLKLRYAVTRFGLYFCRTSDHEFLCCGITGLTRLKRHVPKVVHGIRRYLVLVSDFSETCMSGSRIGEVFQFFYATVYSSLASTVMPN